jgi:hypothetical protein
MLQADLMTLMKNKTPPNPTPSQTTRAAAHMAPTAIVSAGITGDSRGEGIRESVCIDQASRNS